MIEHDTWTESNTKLKLETWGMKKIYTAEKVLNECTVDDIVTLFTYKAEEKKEDENKDKVQNLFLHENRFIANFLVHFEWIEHRFGSLHLLRIPITI